MKFFYKEAAEIQVGDVVFEVFVHDPDVNKAGNQVNIDLLPPTVIPFRITAVQNTNGGIELSGPVLLSVLYGQEHKFCLPRRAAVLTLVQS